MGGAVLTEIILVFVLLGISGLFAISEIVVVSAREAQLQQRAELGDPTARGAGLRRSGGESHIRLRSVNQPHHRARA